MYFVYILQSIKNSGYYIGSTNDFERRLVEHNSNHSHYDRSAGPFKLVFKQEYPTSEAARAIELKLKSIKSKVMLENTS